MSKLIDVNFRKGIVDIISKYLNATEVMLVVKDAGINTSVYWPTFQTSELFNVLEVFDGVEVSHPKFQQFLKSLGKAPDLKKNQMQPLSYKTVEDMMSRILKLVESHEDNVDGDKRKIGF